MFPKVDEHVAARLPWEICETHRDKSYHLMMLVCAVRVLDGLPVRDVDRRRLASWRHRLSEVNAVVEYDPTSLNGCRLTPRLEGDGDLTRPPMAGEER